MLSKPTFFFLLYTTFLYPTNSIPFSGDIHQSCRGVPHPAPCRHLLARSLNHRTDLYKLSVEAALNRAVHADNRFKNLGAGRRTDNEKTAWLDCRKLFGTTVAQLNRTAGGNCTALDSQTWLSAALTNIHTCANGFSDLNANASSIQPVMRYHVSDLISNCLALNNVSFNGESTDLDDDGRRNLLQDSRGADFTVAKDGSGDFRRITAALDAAAALRRTTKRRIVVHVKKGVYAEYLQIGSSLSDVTLTGAGKGKTVITGGRSVALGFTTFGSPTVSVFGNGFVATGLTIRNTFGPGSQAVALLSGSDQSVFFQLSIEGYQDTLCVHTQRQFYRECDVFGTIDFIFGNAAAIFQNCSIVARTPRKGEANVVTAQGRTDQNQNTGIVIQFSKIIASPEFWPVHRTVKSYLGRPWQVYSRTLYLQNYVDSIIDPAGWLQYHGKVGLDTLYYVEFQNVGPGSKVMRGRVKWKGFHIIRRSSQVRRFTVGRFIAGRTWLPATGVPFASGL